jgi:hypothetical protein
MSAVKGGQGTIMETGTDSEGDYQIIDTGTQCVKVYTFRFDDFPPVH